MSGQCIYADCCQTKYKKIFPDCSCFRITWIMVSVCHPNSYYQKICGIIIILATSSPVSDLTESNWLLQKLLRQNDSLTDRESGGCAGGHICSILLQNSAETIRMFIFSDTVTTRLFYAKLFFRFLKALSFAMYLWASNEFLARHRKNVFAFTCSECTY